MITPTYKLMRSTSVGSLAFATAFFVFANVALAASVAQDTDILIVPPSGSGTKTLVLKANSNFNSLTISSGILTFVMSPDQQTIITSADGRQLDNDRSLTTACSNTSQLTILFTATTTINISMGPACSSGGGGGSVVNPILPPPPPPPPTASGDSTPPPSGSTTTPPPPADGTTPSITTPQPPTYISPPAVVASLPSSELSMGAKNEDVTRLQALLASDSDIYPEGRITGYFGPLTQAAVRRFQAKHGIPQVGRVGPLTLAKLAEVFGAGVSQSSPTPSPAVSAGDFTQEMQVGDEGDDVTQLQLYLAQDKEVYPEGRVTGTFGPLTQAAVRRFQAKHGIPQVGRVGPLTLAKLNELMQ